MIAQAKQAGNIRSAARLDHGRSVKLPKYVADAEPCASGTFLLKYGTSHLCRPFPLSAVLSR